MGNWDTNANPILIMCFWGDASLTSLLLKLDFGFNILHAYYPLVETDSLEIVKRSARGSKTKEPRFSTRWSTDPGQVFRLGFESVCGKAPGTWHGPNLLPKINSLNRHGNPRWPAPLLANFYR